VQPELPTGTVTFLFTDIEGSTRLLRELGGEDYAAELARHRELLRDVFGRHGGVEVDTQGDAFFVAFGSARDAVAAAREAQESLAGSLVRVRMGLHTGEALVTGEGYVGMDVHRAARIAAVAHGRQVVLSRATRAVLDADVPVCDLGEHRLKDLSAPERLYQLGDAVFPPLTSLHPTNLPVPGTAFVGRVSELAAMTALLRRDDVRLLTLTGAGGSGKTRLALQAAAGVSDAHRDGVWWVPLSSLVDAELVLEAVRGAVGAPGDAAAHLRDRSSLLLLDNFEHVVDAAADVAALLSECPQLKILVTSREPLRLHGEHRYDVPPLRHDDAIALFTARARAIDPVFEPNGYASEICRRLDELPLALELAAARVSALAPSELVKRLDKALPLLTGGARDLPSRQRTLRATIAWSHGLLAEDEQQLFRRLAVFVAGCTIDAAQQVAQASIDTLQSLVDKSLVRHAGSRYWMLATVREYAGERLAASGEEHDVQRQLADYFLGLVEPEPTPAERSRLIAQLVRELDNYRSAVAASFRMGDSRRALRLANRARWFGATPGEQIDSLERGLADDDVPERLRLDSTGSRAWAAWSIGDFEAAARFGTAALEGYRRLGLRSPESRILRGLGQMTHALGRLDEARVLLQQAYDAGQEDGERYNALHALAELELSLGNLDDAAKLFEKSIALAEKAGDRLELIHMLHGVGDLALAQNDLERATVHYTKSLRLAAEIGQPRAAAYCVAGFASIAAARGQTARAGELWGAVEKLEQEIPFPVLPHERARYEERINTDLDTTSLAFAAAYERGRRMTVDEIIGQVLTAGHAAGPPPSPATRQR
jgi:predicted ATPase